VVIGVQLTKAEPVVDLIALEEVSDCGVHFLVDSLVREFEAKSWLFWGRLVCIVKLGSVSFIFGVDASERE
jgi:hypothetical protein